MGTVALLKMIFFLKNFDPTYSFPPQKMMAKESIFVAMVAHHLSGPKTVFGVHPHSRAFNVPSTTSCRRLLCRASPLCHSATCLHALDRVPRTLALRGGAWISEEGEEDGNGLPSSPDAATGLPPDLQVSMFEDGK